MFPFFILFRCVFRCRKNIISNFFSANWQRERLQLVIEVKSFTFKNVNLPARLGGGERVVAMIRARAIAKSKANNEKVEKKDASKKVRVRFIHRYLSLFFFEPSLWFLQIQIAPKKNATEEDVQKIKPA
jgi:hypothetical protein